MDSIRPRYNNKLIIINFIHKETFEIMLQSALQRKAKIKTDPHQTSKLKNNTKIWKNAPSINKNELEQQN